MVWADYVTSYGELDVPTDPWVFLKGLERAQRQLGPEGIRLNKATCNSSELQELRSVVMKGIGTRGRSLTIFHDRLDVTPGRGTGVGGHDDHPEATARRASASAWASFWARWSATPDSRVCTSPPPRSSADTISPIAAFTNGGPPRKIVPWFFTMIDSSLIAGM